MKKYAKVGSFFLFAALAVFVLFQYQNCGGNNNNVAWSQVGASGVSYLVTVTPSATTVVHGSNPSLVTVNVQASGPELLNIRIGTIVNGNKNEICSVPSSGPVTNTGNLTCYPTYTQVGTTSLYVDVDDPNFPTTMPMLTCTNPPVAGCVGTYLISVQ